MLKTPEKPYFSRVCAKILPVDFLWEIKGRNVENNRPFLRKTAKCHVFGQKIEIFTILSIFDFSTKSCGLENSFLKTRISRNFIPKSTPLDHSKWIFEQLRKVNKINTSRVFVTHFPPPFPHRAKPCGKLVDNLLFPLLFREKVGKKLFIAASPLSQ